MPISKRLASALLAVLVAAPACKSGPPTPRSHWSPNHWTVDSVGSRMAKHFTGYRKDLHGSYIDYQFRKKKSINTTMRRHFLNNNPDNPFVGDDPSQTAPRPPHSIWPDPLYYIHAEGLLLGLVVLGWSGTYVPVPFDSLVATATGGGDEFFQGGTSAQRDPPPTRKFRIKNR